MRDGLEKLRRALTAAYMPVMVGLTPGVGLATVPGTGVNPCTAPLLAGLPSRPFGAPTGSQFAQHIASLSGMTRDRAVVAAVAAGNVPDFMRQLQPVTMTSADRRTEITICVTPDYLAIGSNDDFLRVPMGLEGALSIASRHGFILPTRDMVDAIYAQADVRVAPSPMDPNGGMTGTPYLRQHNQTVQGQFAAAHASLGDLVAGHKKDLILTHALWNNPGRVAIYGWHRPNGSPIQPVSTIHEAEYADYSHGVRLVSAIAFVNGQGRSIYEVLADRQLAPILNQEGPMPRLWDFIEHVTRPSSGGPVLRSR